MTLLPAVPPTIVLDTNVVLDWLVFGNPELTALREAVTAGELRWVATRAMRDELGFILEGGTIDPWKPDAPAIWDAWGRHCVEVAEPPIGDPIGRPRCSDPDDQMFIDLAIAQSARWLVTRDKAVLKLARRLRLLGVAVVTPSLWTPVPPQE
jgi:predicted nucleic acid-binding protein